MVPFAMTLNDALDFKVTPLFDADISETVQNRNSYNGILIGTYKCPAQGCHFEWPWVTRQNIQWHEVSRGLSATVEPLVSNGSITCSDANLLLSKIALANWICQNTLKKLLQCAVKDCPPYLGGSLGSVVSSISGWHKSIFSLHRSGNCGQR